MRVEVRPKMHKQMPERRRIAADCNVLPQGFISREYINGIAHDMTLRATLFWNIDVKQKNALSRYDGLIRTEHMPFSGDII